MPEHAREELRARRAADALTGRQHTRHARGRLTGAACSRRKGQTDTVSDRCVSAVDSYARNRTFCIPTSALPCARRLSSIVWPGLFPAGDGLCLLHKPGLRNNASRGSRNRTRDQPPISRIEHASGGARGRRVAGSAAQPAGASAEFLCSRCDRRESLCTCSKAGKPRRSGWTGTFLTRAVSRAQAG
jgi:hypothetical protein